MPLNSPTDATLTGGALWLPATSQQILENDFLLCGTSGDAAFDAHTMASQVASAWGDLVTWKFEFPDWAEDATLNENLRLLMRVSFEHRWTVTQSGYRFRLEYNGNSGTIVDPGGTASYAWTSCELELDTTATWPSGVADIALQYEWDDGLGPTGDVRRTAGTGRCDCGWYVYEV